MIGVLLGVALSIAIHSSLWPERKARRCAGGWPACCSN